MKYKTEIKLIWKDKSMVEELKSEIKENKRILEEKTQIVDNFKRDFPFLSSDSGLFWEHQDLVGPMLLLQRRVNRLNKILMFNTPQKKTKGSINHLIPIAKERNISEFIQFNRSGMAKCIFHEDKTPSLKYNKDTNTCYCFGSCGKLFDVIDVARAQNNLDFKGAVRLLANQPL